jgi:hypothetical protein
MFPKTLPDTVRRCRIIHPGEERVAAMTESDYPGAKDLILHAKGRGVLSETASRALQRPAVLNAVDRALEDSYTVESAGEVLLVTIMPDDSGSMSGPNQHSVIEGHKELLAAMRSSSVSARTLLQTRYLNGTLLNPFQPLGLCTDLSLSNYPCNKGTPLFEQTLITLGTVVAKAEELVADGAARVRTATLLMTDAQSTDDNRGELIREVAAVVTDLQRIGDHIVAGMGFAAGTARSYASVFEEMGIDRRFIFTAQSRDEVLAAFRMFGKASLELTSGREPRASGG